MWHHCNVIDMHTLFRCVYIISSCGIMWYIYPYSLGLFHWRWGDNLTFAQCQWSDIKGYGQNEPEPKHSNELAHYNDAIMSAIVSQITSITIIYSTVYSGADRRKHQSSALLAFVRGINRWPGNPPHKGPVTRKWFQCDDVIMVTYTYLECIVYNFTIIFMLRLKHTSRNEL